MSVHGQSCGTKNQLGTEQVFLPCFIKLTQDGVWLTQDGVCGGWGETGGTSGTPAMLCSSMGQPVSPMGDEYEGSVNKHKVLRSSMAIPHYLNSSSVSREHC